MKTPLMAQKMDAHTGVIVNAPERRPPPPPPLPPAAVPSLPSAADAGGMKGAVTFRGRPSRVLLLKNMIAPGE